MKKGLLLTEMCSEGDCSILWDYDTIPSELKSVYDTLLGSDDSEPVEMDIYEFGNQKLMSTKSVVRIKKGENIEYLGEITICHLWD